MGAPFYQTDPHKGKFSLLKETPRRVFLHDGWYPYFKGVKNQSTLLVGQNPER